MENSSPQHEITAPPRDPVPFKKWTECFKFLKHLPDLVSDDEKAIVIDRIRRSTQHKQLAFEFLLQIQNRKFAAKLRWLGPPMVEILGDGDAEPDLADEELPSAARSWVFRELSAVRNIDDWKRFTSSGRQLWLLLAILKAAPNKEILVESLTAFAECAENCLNRGAEGERKTKRFSADDPKWIAGLIKGRIPAKTGLPKAFMDALFAINSTAALGEELRRESRSLHSQLNNVKEELASEALARKTAENRVQEFEAELVATQAKLQDSDHQLTEERLHNARQGGFNVVARRETTNTIMARVRQGLAHRLENVRGYADRENPNGEEIVSLVDEMENHLAGLGKEFGQ